MEIKIKQSKLNEAIIGNCNMEVPEGKVETKGNVPEVYADAINQRREREKKITDDFKEQDKAIEEFAKESQKTENKPKGTPEMKKLHLSESLFEDYTEQDFVSFVKTQSKAFRDVLSVLRYEKKMHPEYKDRFNGIIHEYMNMLNNTLYESFNEDYNGKEKSIREKAQDAAGSIEEFINTVDKTPDIEEFIEKDDIETLRHMIDKLMNFYHKYSTIMGDGEIFEAVATPTKKRTRGANEERWGIDYSDTDLWLQIYDELDASLENEGTGQQVNRFLKPKKGERYQYIYPHGENDIVVGAMKPEDFAYAKKVADYYGVTYDEPKEDKNPRTNQYYKWTMVIHIPKELEPVEKH